jgi:hypothetical protein
MESKFDRVLAAARKFVRSLVRKKVEGEFPEFLFFSFLPAEIRLIIWKMAVTAHAHPRVQTFTYELAADAIIPRNIRIDNDFSGKSDTPTENKITIKANCPFLQACRDARDITLAVYSRYFEVCTCDGQHYPSCSVTQRRQLGFWKGSAKRKIGKEWCAKYCQGRAYFTSNQIVYLPDMLWFAPAWAGEKAIEHLALPMLAFAMWTPEE